MSRGRKGSALGVERSSGAMWKTDWRPGEAGAICSTDIYCMCQEQHGGHSCDQNCKPPAFGLLICSGGGGGGQTNIINEIVCQLIRATEENRRGREWANGVIILNRLVRGGA